MHYVFTSRCQPLTRLIEQEILWLSRNIKNNDRIILGVVLPDPQKVNERDYHDHWVEAEKHFNPLTYWERHDALLSFVRAHNLERKVDAILPLSRPSTNMEEAIPFLPPDRKMCVPVVHDDDNEEQKIKGIEHQNEEYFLIPAKECSDEFPKQLCMISQELIFSLIALGDDSWDELVSPDVASRLKVLNMQERLMKADTALTKEMALSKINKIYSRTADEDEKMELYWLLSKYLREYYDSGALSTVYASVAEVDGLVEALSTFITELEYEIPVLKEKAPKQHKKFSDLLRFARNLRSILNKRDNIDKSTFASYMKRFEGMRVDWERRKR